MNTERLSKWVKRFHIVRAKRPNGQQPRNKRLCILFPPLGGTVELIWCRRGEIYVLLTVTLRYHPDGDSRGQLGNSDRQDEAPSASTRF